jgi:DNA-binding response OmpR family regulator
MSERTSCRVLLVEDDPDTRDVMARLMRRAGCEVILAGSVGEALGYLIAARVEPTHLLLDLMLPDYNGVTLLKAIRHERARKKMRIAIVSAAGPTSEVFVDALRENPDAVFHKPVSFPEIEAWVQSAA